MLFQVSILRAFGFVPDKCPIGRLPRSSHLHHHDAADTTDTLPTYVHVSGGMFAMIPDAKTVSPRNQDGTHVSPLLTRTLGAAASGANRTTT
jgi:hypothetical protein